MTLDPQLNGFALGLLLGAAKVGFIGTLGFGIAWWRTCTKLRRLEEQLPDPAILEQRLATLEQLADYSAGKLDLLLESQGALVQRLEGPREPPSPEDSR